jgi:hypothetical protein
VDNPERLKTKTMIPKNLIGYNGPCSPGEKPLITPFTLPACAAAPAPDDGRVQPGSWITPAPRAQARQDINRFSPTGCGVGVACRRLEKIEKNGRTENAALAMLSVET